MTRALLTCGVVLLAGSSLAPGQRAGGHARPGPGRGGVTPLDHWNHMSAEERERRLSKLPPERQQAIRERLERFNKLPREEQDRLRLRYERFSSLTPAQQQTVRRQIRSFNGLPAERRSEVGRELQGLRTMTPEDREARVKSDDFVNRYNANERQILNDLSTYLLPLPDPH
jgi:Protein of unknown function (DUF3106)